jgi:hypothetical protein
MPRDDLDIPMHVHPGSAGQGSWRVSRRQSVLDPATKRLLLIAGGVGATLFVLVGIYSMNSHRPTGIPVVEADPRPVREKPKNPGGMEILGADDAILGASAGKDGVAPPPEAPAPAALLAEARAAAAAPPAAPAAQTPPVSSVPAPTAPPVAATVPAPRPVATPKPPTQTAAAAVAPLPTGGMQVQLAALPTEQAAMTEWDRLSKKLPDMLASRRPAVSRVEHDGKTYYRLRTGGFTDVAQATSFCQHVREKGLGCSIASF